MSTWVTHLMIADRVLEQVSGMDRHGFCVGNIAPDCNVENEDWTYFTPSREVTHWMSGERKAAADCDRFSRLYRLPSAWGNRAENKYYGIYPGDRNEYIFIYRNVRRGV